MLVGAAPETVAIVLVEHDPSWPERFEPRAAAHRGGTRRKGAVDRAHRLNLSRRSRRETDHRHLRRGPRFLRRGFVHSRAGRRRYELRIREPGWHEHRMLRTPARDVHLHVFTLGSSEIDRVVAFRDWLRANGADRELYASTKRSLAQQDWPTMQHYADAKTDIVEAILARAAPRTTVDGGAGGRTSFARSFGASLTPASEDEDQQRDDCEHHQDNDQDSHRRKLPPRSEG